MFPSENQSASESHGRAAARPSDGFEPAGRHHPIHLAPREAHNRSTIIFVTVVAKDRQRIFANPQAHETLLAAWRAADRWTVGCYVLMPDHLHFFCAPHVLDCSLEKWMSFWKDRASKAWPRSEEKPLFQRDHRDRQLRRGENYRQKWDYIRANPVRAGLVEREVDWPYQGELNVLPW